MIILETYDDSTFYIGDDGTYYIDVDGDSEPYPVYLDPAGKEFTMPF